MPFYVFLIVCPMLFMAGFVDSIAGGGGLISLPAYLFAGLPIPSVFFGFLGSAIGARLSLLVSEKALKYMLLGVLPVAALVVFLLHGQVLIPLGIAAALSNMLGNYFGSGLVMTKGPKIVKPLIIFVLTLLLIKIIVGF